MTGLLNQNSGYMQTARKSGERVAQSRGLLNSGLAGEYGQKAAIESSLPIAQQDASQRFQSGMAQQQGRVQGALNTQQYGNEANIVNLQSQNAAGLSTLDANQKSSLLAQEGTQDWETQQGLLGLQHQSDFAKMEKDAALRQLELDKQAAYEQERYQFEARQAKERMDKEAAYEQEKYTFAAQHDKEVQQIQNDNTMSQMDKQAATQMSQLKYETAERYKLEQLNNESREKLVGWELTSGETKAAASSITLLGDNLLGKIVAIDTDPNMTPEAKTVAIQNAQDSYYAMVDNIGLMYGAEVTWE
jgi:hypothetical protein